MKRSLCLSVGVAAALVAGLGAMAEECAIAVQPGASIQAAIDVAPEGVTICLAAGEREEHLVIVW